MIDAAAIPGIGGDLDEVEAEGRTLRRLGRGVADTGVDVHTAFQGLRPFYSAPKPRSCSPPPCR